MDKKKRIIFTMLELVVKQGFHATPMSQVARESNVAVGTIYHYFENKEQIIEEIYMMINRDFSVILLANLPQKNYKNEFEIVWLNLYNYFINNPLAFKFCEFVGVPPLISPQVRKSAASHFPKVSAFYQKGIDTKELKKLDIRLILQLTYGNVISALRLKIKEELPMNETQVKQAIQASWDALKLTE